MLANIESVIQYVYYLLARSILYDDIYVLLFCLA